MPSSSPHASRFVRYRRLIRFPQLTMPLIAAITPPVRGELLILSTSSLFRSPKVGQECLGGKGISEAALDLETDGRYHLKSSQMC